MRIFFVKAILSSVVMLFFISVANGQPLKRYEYIKHKTAVGESLSSVLKIYNIPLTVVAVDNTEIMDNDFVLTVGKELYIRKVSIGAATTKDIDQQIKAYNQSHASKVEDKIAPLTKTDLLDHNLISHRVEAQETLYSISKKYNVSVDDILGRNPNLALEGLKAGSTIIVKILSADDRTLTPKHTLPNTFKKPNTDESISVAVMLPLTNVSNTERYSFTALYKGALIALDSLKRDGLNVHIDLYDTKKSSSVVDSLLHLGVFDNVDLIVGPIYEEPFSMAAAFAQKHNIPIVSPLIEVSANDGVVVQMTPHSSDRYDKLGELLAGRKVVYFNSASEDKSFISNVNMAIKTAHAKSVSYIQYNKYLRPTDIFPYLDAADETVFVVSTKNGIEADMILSKIASIKDGYPSYKISILASPAFAKFEDAKKSDFFKVETKYITSYHSDRIDAKSYNFEKAYLNFFNERPTMMSYRGYDAMMIFLTSLRESGSGMLNDLEDKSFTPLQVKYTFFRPVEGGKFINDEWPLVIYKTDKTIEVQ
ncbi:MAG: LysM peptidoglycan-binding domain-containing protein [Rikenellaceae bacterium]